MAKKISFSYILNTRLKAREKDGVKRYPVYAQVNYNRNNTHFPFPEKPYLSEKEFENFPQDWIGKKRVNYKTIADKFEEELESIIRFELSLVGDSYTLRGLPKRIDFYETSLYEALNEHILSAELLDVLQHDLTLFDVREMDRLEIYSYINRVKYINNNIARLFPLEKHLSKDFINKSSTLYYIGLCDEHFWEKAKFKDWILEEYHKKVATHFQAMGFTSKDKILKEEDQPLYPFTAMDFRTFEKVLNSLVINFSLK